VAKNIVHEIGDALGVVVTHPAVPKSGDPCRVGQCPGVALIDEDPDDGLTTVKFNGVALLSVKGEAGAIAVGDIVYYDDADAVHLNNSSSGNIRFGYAWGVVGNGATATIPVKIGY
jgi:predicted RecA/RadA family phage recombinase